MRKGLLAIVAIIIAMSMTGCTMETQASYKNSTVGEMQADGKLECIAGNGVCSEWRDTETGVHYFFTATGGLELRVNADGTPYTDSEE